MLELTLRVSAADVEEVLDAVLPALPAGLHVRQEGNRVALRIAATAGTPGPEELRSLAGPSLLELTSAEVPNDWRQRRLARYEPLVIGERFLVRPDWAPPSEGAGLIEVVLGQSAAFGTGLHPTTQTCLTTLAEVPAGGSLADYGCGSGVLSIAAAKLGWSPVIAADIDPLSIEATRANATRNEVEVEALQLDVTSEQPPAAATVVANVPPDIHIALTQNLDQAPALVIASGFQQAERGSVASAWSAHDLRVVGEQRAHEWIVLLLR